MQKGIGTKTKYPKWNTFRLKYRYEKHDLQVKSKTNATGEVLEHFSSFLEKNTFDLGTRNSIYRIISEKVRKFIGNNT